MTDINKIENEFNRAKSVDFRTIRNSPSIVSLIFDAVDDNIVAAYNLLLDMKIPSNKTTLVVKKNDKTVDLSIVFKDTADAINIKGLNYDLNKLDNFAPEHNAFAFGIGVFLSDNKVGNTATRDPFNFLVFEYFKTIN